MFMKSTVARGLLSLAVPVLGFASVAMAQMAESPVAATPAAGPELSDSGLLYELRCKACHDPNVPGAPGIAEMAAKPKAFLVRAMTDGLMKPLSTGLSATEISDIADYILSTRGA